MTRDEKAIIEVTPGFLAPAAPLGDFQLRYKQMAEFCKDIMKEDVDYGIIPGTTKPTLYKPGAEKLTTLFGLSVSFELEKIERWDDENPFFHYRETCHLHRGGEPVASASGSCNSKEKKYRWRWVADGDVPDWLNVDTLKHRSNQIEEFDFAIEKAETAGKYGKPKEYWEGWQVAIENGTAEEIQKKSRAGSEYPAHRMGSLLYRIPNDEIFSIVNTILKMAQKRALVAATLIATNASEFFTQDIEDLDYGVIVDGSFTETTEPPQVAKKTKKADPAPLQSIEERSAAKLIMVTAKDTHVEFVAEQYTEYSTVSVAAALNMSNLPVKSGRTVCSKWFVVYAGHIGKDKDHIESVQLANKAYANAKTNKMAEQLAGDLGKDEVL